MNFLEAFTCLLLIGFSAVLSASEIALFSLSRFQLRSLKEHFRPAYRKIKKLLADPGGVLVTILVINEIINISLTSLIAEAVSLAPQPAWIQKLPLPAWQVHFILGVLFSTPIVLFLCEVTPKAMGAKANRLIAPLTATPLLFVYQLLSPVRRALKGLVQRIGRTHSLPYEHGGEPQGQGSDRETKKLLKEADFIQMLEEGHREGTIQQNELDLIKNVFELDDITVADVYTPFSQMQTLSDQTSLKSALHFIKTQKHSRIPIVSQSDRRRVVGILYTKDLLRGKLDPNILSSPVTSLMRRPLFIPLAMRLNTLFKKFKQQRIHMAVIQGSTGEAVGIVTMTDVLDALFEELLTDEEENGSV